MNQLGNEIITVPAIHIGSGSSASFNEAGGLHSCLSLCEGARVMLVENLWTEQGLVNGTIGTVREFVKKAPMEGVPYAILIHFDTYQGPSLDGSGIVPIFMSTREYCMDGMQCSRRQFPLTIAYAITVHKSQGITIDEAVMDIADRDFTTSLTYVAVPRVKTIQGVVFERPFDFYSRFQHKETDLDGMRREDARRRGLKEARDDGDD
ncbi:ATP-dependent DNA helicase PIF1 [Pseudocercospora fuligena]|uniref:ATP-dependent DNA helicase PIF1 n=1 Tax=Pseudocercospora fuligena TaxID=685502 RepID=A0A8H6RM25_9PEZI|nr:ATP-dependent DNA helicase PIF1 [Pseudocercospora fuligena]